MSEITRTQVDHRNPVSGEFAKDTGDPELVQEHNQHYSPWLKEGIRLLKELEQDSLDLMGNSELYAELSDRVNRGCVEMLTHCLILKRGDV